MPTQRTLLIIIAGLACALLYSIGYISGNKSANQTVQLLNDNGHIGNSRPSDTVRPVETQTRAVTQKRRPETQAKTQLETAEKPKFIFMPKEKAKSAYSWRKQKRKTREENRIGYEAPDNTASVPMVHPDRRILVLPRPRDVTRRRPSGIYYAPSHPVTPGYAVPAPVMQDPYNVYPPVRGYYAPYGR